MATVFAQLVYFQGIRQRNLLDVRQQKILDPYFSLKCFTKCSKTLFGYILMVTNPLLKICMYEHPPIIFSSHTIGPAL